MLGASSTIGKATFSTISTEIRMYTVSIPNGIIMTITNKRKRRKNVDKSENENEKKSQQGINETPRQRTFAVSIYINVITTKYK